MTATPQIDDSEANGSLQEFTLWALESLGISLRPGDDQVFAGEIPEDRRSLSGGSALLRITFAEAEAKNGATWVTPESPFVRDLLAELKAAQPIPNATPRHQPTSVREVSQKLFEPYRIDGGSVHLSGCTLEDRVLLRITYLQRSAPSEDARLRHLFTGLTGETLPADVVSGLRLQELHKFAEAPAVSDDQRRRWTDVATASFRDQTTEGQGPSLLVTAVWCKYAEGKLSFVIGESTASVAFSGWAELLANGSVHPPPLVCPSTGQSSYHLTLTTDGEIAPHEAVAACSQSGQHVLTTQLETCTATGQLALPEYLSECPVSGSRVLRSALAICEMCQQEVSPHAIRSRVCLACRSLQRVSKDDPRMARVLGEYPHLDRWRTWRLAETSSVYVLTARGLLKRLLVVVDRQSLEVRRLATGSRFSNRWAEAAEVDQDELLHRDS